MPHYPPYRIQWLFPKPTTTPGRHMGINFKPRFKLLKAASGDSALNKRGVNQTNLQNVYLSVLPGHTFSRYILVHHLLIM